MAAAGDYYNKHKKGAKQFGEPTDDMALVYVIRAAKMGAAIRTWAFYDEELIGISRASGYSFANEATAHKLLRKCGWTVPTDAGRERAAEIVANRLDRAENDADEKDENSDG